MSRIPVLLIILAGFCLRIMNVFDAAPLSRDDYTIFEAKTFMTGAMYPGSLKPLWQVMIALGYDVMGWRFFVAPLLSVFLGTLAIALSYTISHRMFKGMSGVYAASFCASLLSFIHFSRSSQSQMAAMCFMLAAIIMYQPGFKLFRRKLVFLFLSGTLAGATLFVYPGHASVLILLVLWALVDSYSLWRSADQNRKAQALMAFSALCGGILIALMVPEGIVRAARHSGIPAASWLGGAYLDIFQNQHGALTHASDFLHYLKAFTNYEGLVTTVALSTGVIMAAVHLFRKRSMSMFRGLSILLLPLAVAEVSLVTRGKGMEKYIATFLPGVPIVLGYFVSAVSGAAEESVQLLRRNKVMVNIILLILVVGSGYWRARPRIGWTTGNDAAYRIIVDFDPELIYYSGDVWEFYFGGRDHAISLDKDTLRLSPSSSRRDLLVATHLGSCNESLSAVGGMAELVLMEPYLMATVPAFDHSRSRDINPIRDLGHPTNRADLCHSIYTSQ